MKLFLTFLMVSLSSFGVTNPRSMNSYKAIISLDSDAGYICTGTVVGLNPPTVITARHCVDQGAFKYEDSYPQSIFVDTFGDHYFSTREAYLPGDLAVLVFSFMTEDLFKKRMSQKDLFEISRPRLSQWQNVHFCGYGGTSLSMTENPEVGSQRCGENFLLLEDASKDFSAEASKVFMLSKTNTFRSLHPSQKSKYIYSLIQSFIWAYGKGTRYGVGALSPSSENPYGEFDESISLTREGDSGGPLFIKGENGKNILIGVTSGTLKREERLIGAFFWRIDHTWSKSLLRKVFNHGGDIDVSIL